MLKRITDRNIWLVYAAILLLGLGYGMAISLIAIFLDERGFTKEDIGSLAVWFALGIVAFSLPVGALIRRFSARTTLIAALAGYALAVTAFPFLPSYRAIAAVRFFDGACSVGVWVSCETILLSRADKENKAFITSLYAIAIALGYVLGPICSKGIVALLPMRAAFVVAGVFAVVACALVLLRLDADVRVEDEAPSAEAAAPAGEPRPSGPALLWKIKTSCLATFSYGYFQASVVLFLPLYLIEHKGITKEQTILVPAFFAVGMLGFSNVAGRLGDRHGHLLLMRIMAVVGTAMIIGFIFLDRYAAMCAAVLVAGASLAAISPVSLALQGVVADPRDYSRSNAIYNVFYAAGMLLGPAFSSRIYAASGGPAMLWHLAALWTAFILFTAVFYRDDPAARRPRGVAST